MRRIDIIKRAGRNLRQSKGRTILTALAISVGAFTIGLALMAGEGGRLYTNSMVDAAGDKKVIMVRKKLNRITRKKNYQSTARRKKQKKNKRRSRQQLCVVNIR